jgi:hypothetical protein
MASETDSVVDVAESARLTIRDIVRLVDAWELRTRLEIEEPRLLKALEEQRLIIYSYDAEPIIVGFNPTLAAISHHIGGRQLEAIRQLNSRRALWILAGVRKHQVTRRVLGAVCSILLPEMTAFGSVAYLLISKLWPYLWALLGLVFVLCGTGYVCSVGRAARRLKRAFAERQIPEFGCEPVLVAA